MCIFRALTPSRYFFVLWDTRARSIEFCCLWKNEVRRAAQRPLNHRKQRKRCGLRLMADVRFWQEAAGVDEAKVNQLTQKRTFQF
jgi:hypothetical protein